MDYLSIDDYYKVYGYAYFYKADRVPVNEVFLEELTISLVSGEYVQETSWIFEKAKRLPRNREISRGYIMWKEMYCQYRL